MTSKNEDLGDDNVIPLDEDDNTNGKPLEGQEYLDPEDLQQPVINFNVNDAAIALVKDLYQDVDAAKDMAGAKDAKKVLIKMRTTLTAAHKDQKAESLAYGKTLDTEKNRLMDLIAEVEDPISTQITKIKNAEIEAEEERLGIIQDHIERLKSYSLDRHDLSIEQIKERRTNLATEPLTEEIYQENLEIAKLIHEEADTKLRIVLQRELDAVEEREKQAKVAEENEALRKQLAESQAANEEREAKQRQYDAEQARVVQEAQDAEIAKQQEEIDRLQRIADADAKRQKDEDDAESALRRAPDRDKLLHFADMLDELIKTKPVMESMEGGNTMLIVCADLIALIKVMRELVEEMK